MAHNFRGDWQMLWKEIGAGFLIAGFIALLPMAFFNDLFLTDAPAAAPAARERDRRADRRRALVRLLGRERAARRGALGRRISFSGVIAFIYADLIVIPIVLIYRKLLRLEAWRIVAIMFVAWCSPRWWSTGSSARSVWFPTSVLDRLDHERGIAWNYTTALNIVFTRLGRLFGLTLRRGASDPVCGMTVDRGTAVTLRARGAHLLLLRAGLPGEVRG